MVRNQHRVRRRLRLQIFIEPRESTGVRAVCIRAFKPMPRARDSLNLRRHPGRNQPLHQPQRLFIRHVRVKRAMNRQNGHRTGRHPVQRTAADMCRPFMVKITAQEHRQHFRSIHRFRITLRKVRRPVLIHHALHAAGLLAVRARSLKLFYPRRQPQHQHQMPARTAAQRTNMFRVDVVFCGIRPQEAHGRLYILNRGGKLVGGGEAIVYGCRHVTALRELHGKRDVTLFRAPAKAAPVYQQNRRPGGIGSGFRSDHIHCLFAAHRRVFDAEVREHGVREFTGVGGLCEGGTGQHERNNG